MFKVVKLFTDLKDGGHLYNVGDRYPREGLQPTEERIKELSGSNNKQKAPLIVKVEDVKKDEIVEEPQEDILEEVLEEPTEVDKPKKKSKKK